MSDPHPRSGDCRFCGRSVPDRTDGRDGEHAFCSTGCRTLHGTLPDDPGGVERTETVDRTDTGPAGREGSGAAEPPDETGAASERRTAAFFQVEGMHTATDEAFLESVAEGREGVVDAEASYVTETVRVEYAPGRITEADLRDALNTTGYAATPRADAAGVAETADGPHERGLEDTLELRYVVGVVFGSFMLLPYVVLFYPAQVVSLLGGDAVGLFAGGAGGIEGDSLMILPPFLGLTSVVLYFTGAPLLRGAYVSLKMRRPTTDLLVALAVVAAYVYSTVALLAGRFDVFFDLTILVTAGVVAAVFYESLVKRRAVDRLTDLTVSQVEEATRFHDDGTTSTVAVEDLAPGDRVLVGEGERVPVDGVLAEGDCTVDEAVVTGESRPVLKAAGDEVVGGSVVTGNGAVVRVGDAAESGIDRLTTAVWNLQSATHGVQRRADELAGRVVPAVVGLAALGGGIALALGRGPVDGLLASLLVVVVASPWAIGLATPLSVARSLEEALNRGIVVFDETLFERLRAVDVVVFDKTGTLTTGEMAVVDADAPDDLLAATAALERRSSHPAANAIVDAFASDRAPDDPAPDDPTPSERAPSDPDAEEPPRGDGGTVDEAADERRADVGDVRTYATGVGGTVDGADVLVGHPDCFDEQGWTVGDAVAARVADERDVGRLPVVVGRDGRAEGLVVVRDEPRAEWRETVTSLGERGVDVVVLTGDDEDATDAFGRHPHVDHVFAGVPPEGKTEAVRRLQSDAQVAMVGDGTNDAPALARADLGISLGGGTALAAEAADVAVVDDDLRAVETAFDLAQRAQRRVAWNGRLAFVYNALVVSAVLAGLFAPVVAAVAAVLTGVLVAANASRPLVDD